jgi:hypothetical protein
LSWLSRITRDSPGGNHEAFAATERYGDGLSSGGSGDRYSSRAAHFGALLAIEPIIAPRRGREVKRQGGEDCVSRRQTLRNPNHRMDSQNHGTRGIALLAPSSAALRAPTAYTPSIVISHIRTRCSSVRRGGDLTFHSGIPRQFRRGQRQPRQYSPVCDPLRLHPCCCCCCCFQRPHCRW